MLDGRSDIAVLWDIRVHPDYRSQGLGKWLIDKSKELARKRNCKYLKIETQNNNTKACKFYHAMGAKLDGIRKNVYTGDEANEIQFLWYLDLTKSK
jgi:ribosomal protein S18 acetylase RimI-like enzyme